ncbi:MAG: hypothetical protein ACSHYF_09570 [Verrucomicrobiaceae bacterium]
MSDEKPDPDEENVPEGMVKKVRRVRRKRRSKQSESAGSIFDKGKELLKKMEDDDDGQGHVDVAEQIRRLKKDGDEDKPLDDVWGTKKRSTSWLWISLVAVIVPVIGMGIGIAIFKESKQAKDKEVEELKIFSGDEDDWDAQDSSEPHSWFHADSMVATNQAVDILRLLNLAESPTEVMEFIRNSPYRELNPVDLEAWGSPARIKTLQDISWQLETVAPPGGLSKEKRGYLVIRGKREDEESFEAFFVHEDGKVLLDWDATMAWSEVSFPDLVMNRPRNAVIVRGLIEKKAAYDTENRRVQYSGYRLTSPTGEEFIFASVPLTSDRAESMDEELKTILNYGRWIGELRMDKQVTLRIQYGNEQGVGSRFEIVDVLHEGWVRP